LFVYLAHDAPVAVVLRRGPSDWARLSVWNTDTDTIEHGQWLKGRIYERRSDLSADGSLFCAFVRQSGIRPGKVADSWIALSRPPYFSALAVWFVGGTYHTGGFFPERSSVWLGFTNETAPDLGAKPDWLHVTPPQAIAYIDGTLDWPDRTVHFNRLVRDGWALDANATHQTMWKRRHSRLPVVLHMLQSYEGPAEFGGPYRVEYSIWDEAAQRERPIGKATWADWDHRGRLIVAREGQLLEWSLHGDAPRSIADITGQAPDPQAPPKDVLTWPEPPIDGQPPAGAP
jgi:hypothetical protein